MDIPPLLGETGEFGESGDEDYYELGSLTSFLIDYSFF
jgi:hypothetical protein